MAKAETLGFDTGSLIFVNQDVVKDEAEELDPDIESEQGQAASQD